MRLPIHQVCARQPRPAQGFRQPPAEVMPRALGRQTGPQPAELMGPLSVQANGMQQLVVDRFDALPDSGQPAPQGLRPWRPTLPLWWPDDLGPGGLPPHRLVRLALKALIDAIGATGGGSNAGQPRRGRATQGTAGLGQGGALVLAGPKPKPVSAPTGVTASSRWHPAYQPRRLLQPLSARPGNQPAPRRLASRGGPPELSRASEAQRGAAKSATRCRKKATSASCGCRLWRVNGSRAGNCGKAACQ
jgi:hypothetical protein